MLKSNEAQKIRMDKEAVKQMANIREYIKKREKAAGEHADKVLEMDYFKQKLRLHRGRKVLSAALAVLLSTGLIMGYQYYRRNLVYTGYDVLAVSELTETSGGEYKAYGDYILRYSMDGISCMDKNGALVWGQAYEIKNPCVRICGDYVAVAALRGNEVYIFNKSGYQGELKTQYPIHEICVAGQGVVAVLMEDNGENYIKMYDVSGTELVVMKTVLEGEGYPFAIALSEDGRKLAVSFLNIADNMMKNTVEFYNFSEVGQNYVEQLVGTYIDEFEDSLVPDIKFVNNDTVCAFADNQLVLFKMKEIPELLAQIPIEEKVHAVFYDKQYIGLITEDAEDGVQQQLQVYRVKDGSVVAGITGKKLDREYRHAFFTEDSLVLYNQYDCEIVTIDGKEKFNCSFEKGVLLLKAISGTHYNMITSSSLSEIRLK